MVTDLHTCQPDNIKQLISVGVSAPSNVLFAVPISAPKTLQLSMKVTLILPKIGASVSNTDESYIMVRCTKQIQISVAFDDMNKGQASRF